MICLSLSQSLGNAIKMRSDFMECSWEGNMGTLLLDPAHQEIVSRLRPLPFGVNPKSRVPTATFSLSRFSCFTAVISAMPAYSKRSYVFDFGPSLRGRSALSPCPINKIIGIALFSGSAVCRRSQRRVEKGGPIVPEPGRNTETDRSPRREFPKAAARRGPKGSLWEAWSRDWQGRQAMLC